MIRRLDVIYLCNGDATECKKTFCAFNGTGECTHTRRLEHALHKEVSFDGLAEAPEADDYLYEPIEYDWAWGD